MKKLLTLADLYDFYFKENKDLTFDSKTMNSSVIVHYDESFKFEENKMSFIHMANSSYVTLRKTETVQIFLKKQ